MIEIGVGEILGIVLVSRILIGTEVGIVFLLESPTFRKFMAFLVAVATLFVVLLLGSLIRRRCGRRVVVFVELLFGSRKK